MRLLQDDLYYRKEQH